MPRATSQCLEISSSRQDPTEVRAREGRERPGAPEKPTSSATTTASMNRATTASPSRRRVSCSCRRCRVRRTTVRLPPLGAGSETAHPAPPARGRGPTRASVGAWPSSRRASAPPGEPAPGRPHFCLRSLGSLCSLCHWRLPGPRRWGPCLGRCDSHADQGAVATQFSSSAVPWTSPVERKER